MLYRYAAWRERYGVRSPDRSPYRLNRAPAAYTFRREFSLWLMTTIRIALFWIASACCVFAEVAILRSLLFGRARAAEQQHANGPGAGRTSRPAEIARALLPALGLLFVLYLTWRAVDRPSASSSDFSRVGATIGV
jgi:heme/copper-type cytochrome/quinol oxidase subunit 2